MKITSKTGEKLNFLETGVDGIYVLNHAAFKGKFDERSHNDWETSTGKEKLQEWAERNLPSEVLEQFDIDLPTDEEVFSQKVLNLYESSRKLKSKQFLIFKDSDNRMMELDGKPVRWWTRSAYAGYAQCVWLVTNEGSMDFTCAGYTYGFVPVLRRKTRPSKTKKIKDLTIWECRAICNANDACGACPLKYVCDFSPKSLGGTILVTEVEVPKK